MNSNKYYKLNMFLKEKFGCRVEKICIDGGFTCPNRDGRVGVGGCVFCGESRTGEVGLDDIRRQAVSGLSGAKTAGKYIVYFQNYSNTYGQVDELRAKYDAALVSDNIVSLAIATRPDCITPEIAALLGEYAKKYYVWVELGLQTANERTATLVNRGYDNAVFESAIDMLKAQGVDVVCHMIIGLPDETDDDICRTAQYISSLRVDGIKIHSLYVTKTSPLYPKYLSGEYQMQTFDQYVGRVAGVIRTLRKDIVVHRITGDCPRGELALPEWGNRKKLIRNAVEKILDITHC